MPAARRSVGFAKRHSIAAVTNNAPGLYAWSDHKNWVGDPDNITTIAGQPVAQPRDGLSLTRLNNYATNRMIAGGAFIHSGVEVNMVRGGNHYPSDGSLVTSPRTSDRAWYQQFVSTAVRPGWPGGISFKQRCIELGIRNFVSFHGTNSQDGVLAMRSWHDDAAWGASTVAGATTPTAGSLLADFIAYCTTAYNAGFEGVYIDPESSPTSYGWNYATKPAALTQTEVRAFVLLRGRQLARVVATFMPVSGDPEIGMYWELSLGGIFEFNNYVANNGSPPGLEFSYQSQALDSLAAGLACEPNISGFFQPDHTFYRDSQIYGDSTAGDDGVTKYANAYAFNIERKNARLSQLLAADGTLTDADRVTAMANTNRNGFVWPGDDVSGGTAITPALYNRMTREAVKWSMGGRHYFYIRGGTSQFNETSVYDDLGPTGNSHAEQAWQANNVPAAVDVVAPTVAITSPTSSATYSTTGTTVTLGGTVTDDFAVARVEVNNAATGVTGIGTTTWANADSHWIPLNTAELPRRTSWGRADRLITWTSTVALAVGDNPITVTVYDIHGNTATDTLTVTATSTYAYDFAGTGPWVGWTTFAGTVDLQSGKGRTQTIASPYASAGAYLNTALPQDYEFTGNGTLTTVTAAEAYGIINVRAATTTFTDIRQHSSWNLRFFVGTGVGLCELYRVDASGNYSSVLASGADKDFIQGSVLRVRVRVDGPNIKVRYWKNAETEPGTWDIDYSDFSAPTGTSFSVANRNGNDAAADRIDWDDFIFTAVEGTEEPEAPDLLVLFQSIYPATGTQLYVDKTLGSDGNPGTTGSPKATIQGAVNIATAGTRITVRSAPSSYAPFTFNGKNGTQSNWIHVIAEEGTTIQGVGAPQIITLGTGTFCAMYGFEIIGLHGSSGLAQYEVGAYMDGTGHSFAVWNCHIHHCSGHAFATNNGSRFDVCYNRMHDTSQYMPDQGSAISAIGMPNGGGRLAWVSDGYMNRIIGNVIDAVWGEEAFMNGAVTDGNCIIIDQSQSFTGRTLIAHNLGVGSGGRGIHAYGANNCDIWLNTMVDTCLNLPGTWIGALSLTDSSGSNCQYNVGAAKPGSNRVGIYQNSAGSAWNNNVFVRGTGGSEANDPGVASNNNVNKTSIGPSGYFQAYQAGVYKGSSITAVAGFRPVPAQVATFAPPTNIRNAVGAWPDPLGFNRPAVGVWAHGCFEAITASTFDPPAAAAISGMSATPFKDYDWASGTTVVWTGDPAWGSVSDFQIVNADDTPNNEKSASKPSNVTIEDDAACSGGKFLRLTMRQESWKGQPYSGVQMENFGTLYGNGAPFFVECRLRWTGFDGFWCGPWMYDLSSAAEVDIMETINNRPAYTTLHSPEVGTHAYTSSLPDGQWHRYGLRFDFTGVYRYYDNVLESSVVNSSIGTAFCNAHMGFKFQAFVGGTWPDSDAGHTTPSGVTFPQVFDCDWLRMYR